MQFVWDVFFVSDWNHPCWNLPITTTLCIDHDSIAAITCVKFHCCNKMDKKSKLFCAKFGWRDPKTPGKESIAQFLLHFVGGCSWFQHNSQLVNSHYRTLYQLFLLTGAANSLPAKLAMNISITVTHWSNNMKNTSESLSTIKLGLAGYMLLYLWLLLCKLSVNKV